jgi:hypothetical protein
VAERSTDLSRVRCVGSGRDSTLCNGVELQWNATIRTLRGFGRLFDSLMLWAWQLAAREDDQLGTLRDGAVVWAERRINHATVDDSIASTAASKIP